MVGLNVTQRQVGTYQRELPSHQLFLPHRKTKALTVIRRSKPLELLTVDLTALPPQKVQSGSGRSKKKAKAATADSKDSAQYYKWITVAIDAFSRYALVGVLDPMPLRDDGSGPTASKHWEAFAPILNDVRILNGGTLDGVQIQNDNGNEMLGRFSRVL